MTKQDHAAIEPEEAADGQRATHERVIERRGKRKVQLAEGRRYANIRQVMARYACSKGSVVNWQETLGFPMPYHVGEHRAARRLWLIDELDAWDAERLRKKVA